MWNHNLDQEHSMQGGGVGGKTDLSSIPCPKMLLVWNSEKVGNPYCNGFLPTLYQVTTWERAFYQENSIREELNPTQRGVQAVDQVLTLRKGNPMPVLSPVSNPSLPHVHRGQNS